MNKFVQRHLVLGMGKYFEMRDCNRLPIYMNDFSDLIGKNIVIYGAGMLEIHIIDRLKN